MLPIFNIIRLVIYGTVIAWSIIVLGVAAFLEHILVASDLSKYPFSMHEMSSSLCCSL